MLTRLQKLPIWQTVNFHLFKSNNIIFSHTIKQKENKHKHHGNKKLNRVFKVPHGGKGNEPTLDNGVGMRDVRVGVRYFVLSLCRGG